MGLQGLEEECEVEPGKMENCIHQGYQKPLQKDRGGGPHCKQIFQQMGRAAGPFQNTDHSSRQS